MWSGPRNISTAMLRSWGNRPDAFVTDEPFYAPYLLNRPEVDHPGREEVLERHETDWRKVVEWLSGPVPGGRAVWYQKPMAHHLLPEIGRGWFDKLTHCFLIRDPREMLTSLIKKYPNATLEQTGLRQQVEIFDAVRKATGQAPPVLDAKDVLEDPARLLGLLCERLNVPFTEAMLTWPPGRRETDGVWAKHWYDAVERSTGFQPYKAKNEEVPAKYADMLDVCLEHYDKLHESRLR
ncbi:MAG: HAD family hydrolase [Planctomycetes bacterium]|nr:HAD family hydrolase [Planctomycetota bacterium]